MTCEECEQILLDSGHNMNGVGSMPGASVSHLAKSHAQNCPACAARMLAMARLNDALNQLRLSTMHVEAPAAVEAKLLAVFRREMAMRPSVARVVPWRLRWGAVAAVLLIAAGLLFDSVLGSKSRMMVQTEKNHSEQKQVAPALSSATDPPVAESRHSGDVGVARSGGVVKTNKLRHQRTVEGGSITASDAFFALNGGSNVVRVRLPLSSLTAMGVLVRPDVADQQVTADVTRDPFGAVVAIHLVEDKPLVE